MADMNARDPEIIRPPEASPVSRPERRPEKGPERRKETRIAKVLTGASTTGAAVGAGAAVLGILGLVGIWPFYMAAIATIAVGTALVIEGAGIAAQYSDIMSRMNGSRYESAQIGSGVTTQTLGGLTGIALGILALVGIAPAALIPIAVIVFGGAILLSAPVPGELESLIDRHHPAEDRGSQAAHQAIQAAEGSRVLVGLGSVVLGILVLAGVGVALTLSLVALLAIGAAEFLNGSAVGARMGLVLRSR